MDQNMIFIGKYKVLLTFNHHFLLNEKSHLSIDLSKFLLEHQLSFQSEQGTYRSIKEFMRICMDMAGSERYSFQSTIIEQHWLN